MISDSIPAIFEFLQSNYGRITEEELIQKEDDLHNYDYNPWQPVDKVFSQIALFQDLCAITNNDKTDKQLCQMAYLIFNRTRAFVDSLKKWNAKSAEDKTYSKFKKHMRDEHHALKQAGALTIKESSFYQANMIQQVLTQQSELQDNLQASIDQQVKDSLLLALIKYTNQSEEPQVEVANNVTTKAKDASTETILDMIAALTKKVEDLKRPTDTDINPRTDKKFKRYYCSCGCCPHWGKDCPQKKPGHQHNTNFRNRMGGSNKNCQETQDQ